MDRSARCRYCISSRVLWFVCNRNWAASTQVAGKKSCVIPAKPLLWARMLVQRMQNKLPLAPLFSIECFRADSSATKTPSFAKIIRGWLHGRTWIPVRKSCGNTKVLSMYFKSTVKPPSFWQMLLLKHVSGYHMLSLQRARCPHSNTDQ